ncbi:MAG TPA: hypothetical protein VFR37_19570 [Longimicrobium sp.]|nr:hypothetical protein [Longimicrobium sp.]
MSGGDCSQEAGRGWRIVVELPPEALREVPSADARPTVLVGSVTPPPSERSPRAALLRRAATAAVVVLLVGTALLSLVRVPAIWVQGEVLTTTLRFEVPEQDISNALPLSRLSVADLSAAAVPDPAGMPAHVAAADRQDGIVVSDTVLEGQLQLLSMQIPAGSVVRLNAASPPGTFNLGLACAGACPAREAQLRLRGRHVLEVVGASRDHPSDTVVMPRQFILPLQLPRKEAVFHLRPARARPDPLISRMAVSQVGFDWLDERGSGGANSRIVASGIVAGTINFPSLPSSVQRLAAREGLRFRTETGWIDNVEFRGDTIAVAFTARASRITVGPQGYERNLKPTLLAWLYGRDALRLLGSTLLLAIPLALRALQWLGNRE